MDLEDQPTLLANLTFVAKPMDAAAQADALVVLTEWKNYKSPNLRALRDTLKQPLVLDGRNIYEPHAMAAAGLTYMGIGRNNLGLLDNPQGAMAPEATDFHHDAHGSDAIDAMAELAAQPATGRN